MDIASIYIGQAYDLPGGNLYSETLCQNWYIEYGNRTILVPAGSLTSDYKTNTHNRVKIDEEPFSVELLDYVPDVRMPDFPIIENIEEFLKKPFNVWDKIQTVG